MKRMIFLCLGATACVLLFASLTFSGPDRYMIGDMDLDHDIDFSDFVLFTEAFTTYRSHGEPKYYYVPPPDTVTVYKVTDNVEAGIRAGMLIGYWRFSGLLRDPFNNVSEAIYRRRDSGSNWHFNDVSAKPGEDGEYIVYGIPRTSGYQRDHNDVIINPPISIKYNKKSGQYILWGHHMGGMPHRNERGHIQVFFKIQKTINDDMTNYLHSKLIEQTVTVDSMRVGLEKMSVARRNVVIDTIWYHASNFYNLKLRRISREKFMTYEKQ